MKNNGKAVSFLLVALLVSSILAFIPLTTNHHDTLIRGAEQEDTERVLREPKSNVLAALEDHGPIIIIGNQELLDFVDAESLEGEGTQNDPYLIKNYAINRNGVDGHCIYVENTTIYFAIKGCYLANANQSLRAGIHLVNVSNCKIESNTLYQNRNGIDANIENCEIIGNTIIGIELGGIIDYQINLRYSNNTSIIGNVMNDTNYGIDLTICDSIYIENNTLRENGYGIRTGFCKNTSIVDNNLINIGLIGIRLEESDENLINGTFCNGSLAGFYLIHLTDCTISDCTLIENDQGLLATSVGGIMCTRTSFINCALEGVQIDSSASLNQFQWNTFINNAMHFESISTYNDLEYCYYDDYSGNDLNGDGFGDSPYSSDGANPATDTHPLMYNTTPPTWNPAPSNQHIEYGDDFEYALSVSSPSPVAEWTVSDFTHFIIDAKGVINNKVTLEIGTYPLVAAVANLYGFELESNFTLTVVDSMNPIWISEVKNMTYNYGDSIEFQMTAWDFAGIDHWTISDSDHFSIKESSYADTSIATIEATSTLASGAYPLTLSVYDNNDNSAEADFYVIVGEETIDTIDPIWIVLPYDTSIAEGESFYLQVGAWDESGIVSWNLTGSSDFEIDENGVITNNVTLEVGTYDLEVRAYDPEGNYCSAEFTVTVTEVTDDGTDTTTTTTPTQPEEIGDFGFIMSTTSLAIAVVALIMGLGAFLNTRKQS